jgi:hypothetical protein
LEEAGVGDGEEVTVYRGSNKEERARLLGEDNATISPLAKRAFLDIF